MKIEAYQPGLMGKVKILLDQVDSTQLFAAQLLKDTVVANGTLVMARHQSEGRGRLGKAWHSNPAENFTGSLIIKHSWETVPPPFALSQVAALATRALIEDINGQAVLITCPNDIILHQKKISGILISNQWKGQVWESSIVGIGINVNQRSFESSLPQAISLTGLTGISFDMNEIINKLMSFLNLYYQQLSSGTLDTVTKDYHRFLYGINHPVMVKPGDKDQAQLARVLEVVPSGEIKFQMENGETRLFDLDQISILLS